jgi:DNA-binding NarL/FixJ family response regulator
MKEIEKIRTIVIDDEPASLERMEYVLSMFQEIEVIHYTMDPVKAVQLIIDEKPELVFIDVEMPVKNGFTVLSEVHEAGYFPGFIFITAYDQYAIKAIKQEALDYLLKPIDIEELKVAIDHYQKRHSYVKSINLNENPICASLSDREKEVLILAMKGQTSREIASHLFISKATIDSHRQNILLKTDSKNFSELSFKIVGIDFKKQ